MVTRKEQRQVLVLRRYYIKQDYAPKGLHKGDVVLIVRNDAGKEYEVILRRNKAHSCSCPAGENGNRKCYHRTHCIAIENARFDAEKAAKVVPIRKDIENVPLNGNRGFSILREAV